MDKDGSGVTGGTEAETRGLAQVEICRPGDFIHVGVKRKIKDDTHSPRDSRELLMGMEKLFWMWREWARCLL